MVDAMAVRVLAFKSARARVRCFLHIMNIVARVLLAQFGPKADETGESLGEALGAMMAGLEVEDDEESDGEEEDAVDGDDEEIGRAHV